MSKYVYLGTSKKEQEAFIATHMAPLEDDFGPHPRFGGFPEKHDANPPQYYPEDRDPGRLQKEKEKRRAAYRKERLEDLKDAVKATDEGIKLWGVSFRKGEPVELPDDHPLLQPKVKKGKPDLKPKPSKMEMLIKAGRFKKDDAEEPKRGPGRPPKAKDD